MGKHGHKNKKTSHYAPKQDPHQHQQPSYQHLLDQALAFQQIYSQLHSTLHSTKPPFVYLLSTKWLADWKDYSGYSVLIDQAKKGSKKYPGLINRDILDHKPEVYKLPGSMVEYSYLNAKLDSKVDEDDEYIKVTQECWQFLYSRYDGYEIKRPVYYFSRKRPIYDCQLTQGYFILPTTKTLERLTDPPTDLSKIIDYDSIQLSNYFTANDLYRLFGKLSNCLNEDAGQVELVRFDNHVLFAEIREMIALMVKEGVLRGSVSRIYPDDTVHIKNFLKYSYVLLVLPAGLFEIETIRPKGKVKGYCENCLKVEILQLRCHCTIPLYCSQRCLYDDRLFHSKVCKQAYDSDEDSSSQKQQSSDLFPLRSNLVNLGNTCYMNSSLQALGAIKPLVTYFLKEEFKSVLDKQQYDFDEMLLFKIAAVMRRMGRREIVEPYGFKSSFERQADVFRGYYQHDCCDFLNAFFGLVNELAAGKEAAEAKIIRQTFSGCFLSTIRCPNCTYQITSCQNFTILPLPILPKSVVQDLRVIIIDKLQVKLLEIKHFQHFKDWQDLEQALGLKFRKGCWVCVGRERSDLKLVQLKEEECKAVIQKVKEDKDELVVELGRTDVEEYLQLELTVKTKLGQAYSKASFGYNRILPLERKKPLTDVYLRILDLLSDSDAYQQFELKVQQSLFSYQTAIQLLQKELEQEDEEEENSQSQAQSKQQIKKQIVSGLEDVIKKLPYRVVINSARNKKKDCPFCARKRCRGCDLQPDPFRTVGEVFGTKQVQLEALFEELPPWHVSFAKDHGKKRVQLKDCLEQFSEPETLDEENAWFCEMCNELCLAQKSLVIQEGPLYLLIQLKRFRSDGKKKIKNNEPVDYGEELELAGKRYFLLAVIVHEGTMDGGHYWAIRREGEKWIRRNDEESCEMPGCWVANAYVLLYGQIKAA